MLKKLIYVFLLRWATSAFGMWICITLFASLEPGHTTSLWLFVLAGLIFSIVNAVVKPFATLLSLPFILLTMGLFVLILNAAMVALTVWLLPDVHITFGGAILSALTMSLINYLVNFLVPSYNRR